MDSGSARRTCSDYRRRNAAVAPRSATPDELAAYVDSGKPDYVEDDFDELVQHLSTLHPSRYGALLASGVPVDQLFPAQLLAGGYRKKYLRAVLRLISLAAAGQASLSASVVQMD